MFSDLIKNKKKSSCQNQGGKNEKILVMTECLIGPIYLHYCPARYSPQIVDAVPRFSLSVGKKRNYI